MIEVAGKINPSTFSWSLRREYYFRSCRRAYIFYYHLARGGNYSYAATETRLLYRLKYLCPAEKWLQKLFYQSIYHTFATVSTPISASRAADLLRQNCLTKFYRDYQMLKKEEWRSDPKLLNLTEIYYHKHPINQHTLLNWLQLLQHYLEQFINNPFFVKLCGMNSLCWRHFNSPTATNLGELKLWLNPLLIWREHDYAQILLADNHYTAENSLLQIAAASLQLCQAAVLPPERQQVYLLAPDSGNIIMQRPNHQQLTKSWSKIIKNSVEMSQFEYNTVQLNQLPSGTESYCSQCNFREFCQKLG